MEKTYTTKEVAKMLNISTATAIAWAVKNEVRREILQGKAISAYVWTQEDIDKMSKRRTRNTENKTPKRTTSLLRGTLTTENLLNALDKCGITPAELARK